MTPVGAPAATEIVVVDVTLRVVVVVSDTVCTPVVRVSTCVVVGYVDV
jgi:hypothetical protein